ncbi:MAG: VacJ family lipoprotein [Steroidobacteraceae bacterium]
MAGKPLMRVGIGCAVAVLLLAGCATREVEFHHWPAETPAADNKADIARMQGLQAAAAATLATPQGAERAGGAAEPPPPLLKPDDAPSLKTYDPWARLNRFTYRFNARFDEALFLPVANGYRRFVPAPLRGGVHSFFANLSEVDSVINYTLQGRLHRTVRSFGRFVINTTLGIGGLFDIAGRLNIPYEPTGFGTTLAKWGMHPGPYVVMPLLGPSTFREGAGYVVDYATEYAINLGDLYRGNQAWGLGITTAIDQRANFDFRYYSTGSPFEYETIRFLYMRKQLIEDTGLHKTKPLPKPNPEEPAGK